VADTHPVIPRYPAPDPGVIRPAAPADGFAEVGSGRTLEADVVIVGSGPGGASAAWALAETGARVVVLEEGPATSRFRLNQAHTARYHMQEGGSVLAHGRAIFPVAAGRGVGGGSLINSALCFRTPESVLSGWAELLEDERWGPEQMRRLFEEIEPIIGVSITPDSVAGENNRILVRGAQALGLDGRLAPRNTPACAGCGVCNFGCPSGGKASTNLTFLPRAVGRGALIQAETRVHTVLVEGGRARGVVGRAFHPDTREPGGMVTVRADRVILSCGALGTPRLLWSAGLAPMLGPMVGEGLHVHPGNAVMGLSPDIVHLWKGATQGAYFTHPDLPGVLPHTFSAPPEVCLLAMGAVGDKLAEGLEMLPHLCGIIVMVSDHGRGRVRAHADGRLDVRYDFTDEDLDRIKAGMAVTARVLEAAGVSRITAPVHGIGWRDSVDDFTDALADRTITDFTLYSSHPMSTCRMGLDPERSVLDPAGRTHGLEGLYIADASVFPTSLGVNPQLTTMAIAARIARGIAGA